MLLLLLFGHLVIMEDNSTTTKRKKPYIKKKVGEHKFLPLHRVSRQKSQLKKLYRKIDGLESAFVVGDTPYKSTIRKCIEECTYTWITFVKRQEVAEKEGITLTGKDVVHFTLRKVIDFFQTDCTNTYVMIFDKSEFVPKNKQEEQLKRYVEARRVVEPFDWDPEKEPHVLEWNKPLPCDWEAMNTNRQARRQAIRDVVEMIRDNYSPPTGKRLIIDSDTFKDGPLVKTTDVSGTHSEHYIDTRLANCIGEGDNCIMYYVHLFTTEGADVEAHRGNCFDKHSWNGSMTDDILIHCNDTDVWLTLMILYQHRQIDCEFVNRVIVHTGTTSVTMSSTQEAIELTQSSASSSSSSSSSSNRNEMDAFMSAIMTDEVPLQIHGHIETALPPSERITYKEQLVTQASEYIDINTLVECITNKFRLPDAVQSLFLICIMGGNDYVDGYYGLSYTVLLRTWVNMHNEIGSIIEYTTMTNGTSLISINPASYLSLLIRAYWNAYEKRNITNPNPNNPPKSVTVPHFKTPLKHLSLQELRRIVKKIRKKPEDQVPSDIEISQKMLRAQWYLRYCFYSCKANPMKVVPNPTHSAWEECTVKFRTFSGVKGFRTIMARKLCLPSV